MLKNPDVILGNPPYSKKTKDKFVILWTLITNLAIDMLNDGGILNFIHPKGWRGGGDTTKKLYRKMAVDNQMWYIEMHDIDDGKRMFNAATDFDLYVMEKTLPNFDGVPTLKVDTQIVDYEKQPHIIPAQDRNYIVSSAFDMVENLLAKPNEEKIHLIHKRSMYGSDKKHVQKEMDNEYKYPLVDTITQEEPKLRFTNDNTKGFFGSPKVIVNYGHGINAFIDETGDYGVTQFSFAILDDKKNFDNIKKAIESDAFKHLATCICGSSMKDINLTVMRDFRKDFWKMFI
ncbi:MAG: hypothetical protein DRQ40_02665 [Gammaproteobacteria bacterium]|nr:MAG: hypothetical protein DRQ40_02665 [Gammaproteobacteria bacterium]